MVKELVLVDETAGVKVKDLKLREVPFLRCARFCLAAACFLLVGNRQQVPFLRCARTTLACACRTL